MTLAFEFSAHPVFRGGRFRCGTWQAALAVNNLFDKKYYNYGVRSQFTQDRYAVYPLPGRTATASLRYNF